MAALLYHNDKEVLGGVDFELLQAIIKARRLRAATGKGNAACKAQRSVSARQTGLADGGSATEERRGYARFSLPYRRETVSLFTVPEKLDKFKRIDSLRAVVKQRVACWRRAGYYGDDDRAMPLLNAEGRRSTFGTFEQGVKMLEAGRGDLIMGDAHALRWPLRGDKTSRSCSCPICPTARRCT